ncbi:hypothetical protein HMPREF2565_06525 [Corynebacterium sp. HMSC072A04]|nr:hypothetical protein HMPREF2565_06525 [Corynebacterium sp. HMSC072A04]
MAGSRAGKITAGIRPCEDVGDVVAITCLAYRGRGAEDIDLRAVNLLLWQLLVDVVDRTNARGFNCFPASRWHDVLSGLYSLKVGRRRLWCLPLCSLLLCALLLCACLSFWSGATGNGGLGACRHLGVGVVFKRLESRIGVFE